MYRVNTNSFAVLGRRFLFSNENSMSTAMSRLSSGLRIRRSADDAAGITASELMRGQISSAQQSDHNISRAVSMLQIADSGYEQVGFVLIRLKQLAVQAADSSLNPTNRSAIMLEVTELMVEIERIAQSTTYNGLTLINTTGSNASVALSFYVGEGTIGNEADQVIFYGLPGVNASAADGITIGVSGAAVVAVALNVTAGSFQGVTQAAIAVDELQRGIEALANTRSSLGAFVNRMGRAQANVQIMVENTRASNSVIRDADFATETASLARAQILVQSTTTMLEKIHVAPQNALVLLQQ